MKVQELHPDVLVAIINAARDISVAKIRAIGDDFNRDFNFFDREFGRVISAVIDEASKHE